VQWPLLDVLSEDDRRQLLTRARRRRFARNEVIFHEGDPGDSLHLMARGHVALRIHTPLGDVATARIVRSGEFFGELAVVNPGPRNATAVALDAVETIALDRDQLNALLAAHESANSVLIAALVTEVRRLAQQLVETMYTPVDKRLWRRMNDLSVIFGTDGQPSTQIPLTQDVIAELTGCTRPTANRVLRAGEEAGVIRMSRRQIEILDLDGIRQRAR
jgi:CRP/FNR family cyclic AMP-dependent transcriptional regulator